MKRWILFLVFAVITHVPAFSQAYKVEHNEVVTGEQVFFKTGTAILLSESGAALNMIKQYLTDKSYVSLLRVEGHVSGSGNDQELSEARAVAVCNWLVKNGVDCKRLIPVGFGHTKPAADGSTPEGKAQNTRISFVNAALGGHLIGGMDADGGGKTAGMPCNP